VSSNFRFEVAQKNFEDFVQTSEIPDADRNDYLDHWLTDWLEYGHGVEHTGRHYETYLRTCLHIADMALRGRVNIDYRGTKANNWEDAFPRHIAGIENPDDPAHYDDRAVYEIAATRWEQQGRDILDREHGV
jgi:hypothetical protein